MLFTLGTLFGGMFLDQGQTLRRRTTLRRSLIDLLRTSIEEGTFGPLRLVDRLDGTYLTGCGLMHYVRSPEEAENIARELMEELRSLLGGLDPEMLLEMAGGEKPESVEDLRTPDIDEGFTDIEERFEDLIVPDSAEDVAWREWPDTNEPACQTCETVEASAPAAFNVSPTDEPARAKEPPAASLTVEPPDLKVVNVATEPPIAEPFPIALQQLQLTRRSQQLQQIDKTLDEIMSRMLARCPAA